MDVGKMLKTAHARFLKLIFAIAGLVAMIGLTVQEQPPWLLMLWQAILSVSLLFFAIDWILQIVTAKGEGRLPQYILSGSALVDALAVLPVPIALAIGVEPETAWLLASFWLFKLAGMSPGVSHLGRVISLEARPLASVFIIFATILLFAAVALHLLERGHQPGAFGNVPAAMWWAVVTLTTTGYGDAVPVTQLGRLVAAMVMICGLGVFGLLTGILATGFVEESRRQNFVQNWNLVQNVPFFRALEPAAIIEIARMLRRWQVSEGTTVIRRGRQGDCMYFVASGEVEVEIDPPVRLGPGTFFGEQALLRSSVRNANVTTTLPSTLLVLEAADFRTFTAHHPMLADAIEAEAKRRAE